jgi:ZIP family zinc transporter
VIGAAAYNQELATFLIGVGVGAIIQVIGQLLPSIRDAKGQALYPLSIAGLLLGAGILYMTSLLVSV